MTVVRDEDELEREWPAGPDMLRAAAMPLIEAVFAMTSPGRKRDEAMSAVIAVVEKVRAIIDAPKLH